MPTVTDIREAVPVTDRTIRNWVSEGLLPRPVKRGLGRAQGTEAIYPSGTVEQARAVYELKGGARRLLRRARSGGHFETTWEADGGMTIRYIPRGE